MSKEKSILHIYTRVSTRVQDKDGTSLDTQKELGIKKSKELGFKHKVWNEGGASSHHEDLHNRPVLTQLMREVEDGNVSNVLGKVQLSGATGSTLYNTYITSNI